MSAEPAAAQSTPDTFGTARFLTVHDAWRGGLLHEERGALLAPCLGHIVDGDRYATEVFPIYARASRVTPTLQANPEPGESSGHLLTVAPTRAGKGTGQIIPNLLRYEGSALVIDIKGENYLRTAGYRGREMKQAVHRFAPFEIEGNDLNGHAVWNPLFAIGLGRPEAVPGGGHVVRPATTAEMEEDVRYLVNLLVVPSGGTENLFFENSARNFIAGLLLHVRTTPIGYQHPTHRHLRPLPEEVQERSMAEVRRLLTLPTEAFSALLEKMGKSKRPLIRQAATTMRRLTSGDSRVGTSILAFALEQTEVWAYERSHMATYRPGSAGDGEPAPNDFNFRDLAHADTTIYLIVPPDDMVEYRVLFRVLIGCALREQRLWYHAAPSERPAVLYMLDEFPQLARMKPIEEGLLYLAGYGVRLWFFVQDISQLQLHYPESWRTFMANTGTQCFFGVSDIQTANLVSEMAGTITVANRGYGFNIQWGENTGGSSSTGTSYTSSSGSSNGPSGYNSNSGSSTGTSETLTESWGSSLSQGASTNVSYVGRRLIMPDEVLRMHDEEQIIFMKSTPPIRAAKVPYYKVQQLSGRAALPPPYAVKFK